MSTPKHTPGPWEWQRGDRYLKLGQRNAPHESVLPPCDKVRGSVVITPNQANLRLIAAAPAMYEALKASLLAIPDGMTSNTSPICQQIRAALAQAEDKP